MKPAILKICRIGNSRGIRLPAEMLRKYHITETVVVEEKSDGIVLRPANTRHLKLSWEETAKAMAASGEDWPDWEALSGDGIDGL